MRHRFNTVSVVLHFLGSLFILLGVLLLIPLVVVFLGGELSRGSATLLAFLLPSLFSVILGLLLRKYCRSGSLNNIQAMLICALGWVGYSAIGAIPFVIAIDAGYLNGFFETMSGFTTTGITMFTGLDQMPRSILFWRSFTQWLGGLGILTFYTGSDLFFD
ncbi:potassium transporter TrkG, partial [Candidatus Zixiibacteriota bacterium]